MYLKSVENVITLGKLIGLLFLFCLPLLSILFLKTKRNDLARPVMGTIFLVNIEYEVTPATYRHLASNFRLLSLTSMVTQRRPFLPHAGMLAARGKVIVLCIYVCILIYCEFTSYSGNWSNSIKTALCPRLPFLCFCHLPPPPPPIGKLSDTPLF